MTYAEIVVYPEVSKAAENRTIKRLNKWRSDILQGIDEFDFYARTYSDDEGTASKGGSFDCVTKGMFVPEFDAVALSLEIGEISKPFKTQFGWHIVKVEDRRGSTYCGRHILIVPKVSSENMEKAKVKIDSIVKVVRAGDMTFCEAAKSFSKNEETKNNCGIVTNPQNGSELWDVSTLDREVAGLVESLNKNEVTNPFVFKTRDGKKAFKVITVFRRTDPHVANLNDDYELIQGVALNEKKQKEIDKWIASKINTSYVWIAPDYVGCNYTHNWLTTTVNH